MAHGLYLGRIAHSKMKVVLHSCFMSYSFTRKRLYAGRFKTAEDQSSNDLVLPLNKCVNSSGLKYVTDYLNSMYRIKYVSCVQMELEENEGFRLISTLVYIIYYLYNFLGHNGEKKHWH